MASGPITSCQIDGETVETVSDFIFLGDRTVLGGQRLLGWGLMVGLWPLCSGMTPWRWVRKEAVLPGRRVAWLEQATWQALARGRGQRRWSSGARERVWGCGLCALALRTQAPRSAEHSWEPWIVLKSGSQRPIDETCPWACSLPGFSVHGIFQAGVLEWGAIAFPRVSSRPRDRNWGSYIARRFFIV